MKKRLDVLIFEKGLTKSREESRRLIMAGLVLVEGKVFDKPGMSVLEDTEITIKEKMPYVSRGALKLEKAYKEFGIDFKDKIVCDIGASTGGFTDFSLQHGAKKVYAVDVGYGQLHSKVRDDEKVISMERTDFRNLDSWKKFSGRASDGYTSKVSERSEDFFEVEEERIIKTEPIDIFVIDVSFISLKKILPIIKNLKLEIKNSSDVIALIKPQFEVGKEIADKCKGVVKDEGIRQSVVDDIENFSLELGFEIKGITESPIEGAKGNKEFLMYLISSN